MQLCLRWYKSGAHSAALTQTLLVRGNNRFQRQGLRASRVLLWWQLECSVAARSVCVWSRLLSGARVSCCLLQSGSRVVVSSVSVLNGWSSVYAFTAFS